MVVRPELQLTYTTSVLPAGVQADGFILACTLRVSDALDSDSVTTTNAIVTQLQHKGSSWFRFAAESLAAAEGDVNAMTQAVATISSVLNAVNCSLAPDCSGLNRERCSSTPHTCGPCSSSGSYVGEFGDSNTPCFATTSAINVSSSQPCVSSSDCSIWQVCDKSSNRCILQSKQCNQGCSGHGECAFTSSLTGFIVPDCKSGDPTCEASCGCNFGFTSPSCEVSAADLSTKQNLRYQLINAIANLTIIQNPSAQSILVWVTQLNAVMQIPSEISTAAAFLSADVASTILSYAATAAPVDVWISLLDSLDSLLQVGSTHPGYPGSDRRLEAAYPTTNALQLVDSCGHHIAGTMVEGQIPASLLFTSFRVTIQLSSAVSPSSYEPLTPFETASGLLPSAVTLSDQASAAAAAAAAAATTVAAATVLVALQTATAAPGGVTARISGNETASTGNKTSVFTSSTLRLTYDPALCSSPHTRFAFTLQHATPQEFASIQPLNESYSVDCMKDISSTAYHQCSSGSNITLVCDGSGDFVLSKQCPLRVSEPSCGLIGNAGELLDSRNVCRVANFTTQQTTCVCNLCHPLTATTKRRLQTDSSQNSVLNVLEGTEAQIAAIASTSFTQFASVVASAGTFNTVGALRSALIVILAFAVLWCGMAVAVMTSYWWHLRYRRKGKPAELENAAHGHERRRDLLASVAATKHLDAADIEVEFHRYFNSFFPTLYSEKRVVERILHELFRHHAYLKVFARIDLHFETWMGALSLASNLTASMFLLAVFYSIQYPPDDGSCALNNSQAACLERKALFNSEQSICAWQKPTTKSGSGLGFHGRSSSTTSRTACTWQRPRFDPMALITISLAVNLASCPIWVVISSVLQPILLAPTVSESSKALKHLEESEIRRRMAPSHASEQDNPIAEQNTAMQMLFEQVASSFSSSAVLEEELVLTQRDIHRTIHSLQMLSSSKETQVPVASFGPLSLVDSGEDQEHFNADNEFDSAKKLVQDVTTHFCNVAPQRSETWMSQWPVQDEDGLSALQREIDDVVSLSAKWEAKLSSLPTGTIGVRLLQLFVQDLIGRDSRPARIFENQIQAERVEEKLAVIWSIKCLAATALIILNAAFIFLCMLYGRDKGFAWQQGWVIACFVRLLTDACISEVLISILVYFSIPDVIYETTSNVKETMNRTVQSLSQTLVSSANEQNANEAQHQNTGREFSATDYLFVSSRVAKAFPDLVESAVILQYRSASISAEQSAKWAASPFQTRPGHTRFSIPWLRAGVAAFALFIGSQALVVQEELVYCISPCVLGALVSMGRFIVRSPVIGVSAVGGMVLVVATAYLAWRRSERKVLDESRFPASSGLVLHVNDDEQSVEEGFHNGDISMDQSSGEGADRAVLSLGNKKSSSSSSKKESSESSGSQEERFSDVLRTEVGLREGSKEEESRARSRAGSGIESGLGSDSSSKDGPRDESAGKYLRLDGVWVATKEELVPTRFRFESDYNSGIDDELSMLYTALQEDVTSVSSARDYSDQPDTREEAASYRDLNEDESVDHMYSDMESARNEYDEDDEESIGGAIEEEAEQSFSSGDSLQRMTILG